MINTNQDSVVCNNLQLILSKIRKGFILPIYIH